MILRAGSLGYSYVNSAGGMQPVIMETQDGGLTWREVYTVSRLFAGRITEIDLIVIEGEMTAWAVGDGGTLLRLVTETAA